MKIAAVVVTYNRKDLLQECLDAILGQTRKPDGIIVIDNASTDGTELLFQDGEKYGRPDIHYRRMAENLGGAGGFYEGLKYGFAMDMDWLWIMDDDTIPQSTALQALLEAIQVLPEEPSYLASTVLGSEGEPMNVPEIDIRESANGYPDWYYHLKDGLVKIEDATFVSLLINRKAIQKVGLPYKGFFIWGDDKEYTLRLSHYFGSAYMCGNSVVIHKREVTKRIVIEYATDPARIKQYYYNYRNILINTHEYKRGWLSVSRRIAEFEALSLKMLFGRNQIYRWKKFAVIQKGIFGYLFGRYDKKAFKNRFEMSEGMQS